MHTGIASMKPFLKMERRV